MNRYSLVVAACLLFLCACRNEVDVYSDNYEETAVVYALIDGDEATHYVKVNKTFRVKGSVYETLQVHDSLCFSNIVVEMSASSGGERKRLLPLGSAPGRKDVFFINSSDLKLGDSAMLHIYNPESGTHFYGRTSLVIPPRLSNNGYRFVNTTFNVFSVQPSDNGFIYDIFVRLYYSEADSASGKPATDLYYDYFLDQNLDLATHGMGPIEKLFSGTGLVTQAAQLIGDGRGKERKYQRIEYVATAGSYDLRNYISQFIPSGTIVEKSLKYSNVEGGLGIFSSRASGHLTRLEPDSNLRKYLQTRLNMY